MTREEIHERMLEYSTAHNNLILEWATGLGKSYAAIKLQETLNPDMTYVVVAEIAHIENWKKEYIKFGKEELLKKTKIFCYGSLKKNINEEIGLLILDEGHVATSDLRLDHLSTIKASKVVVLSATISPEKKESLKSIFGEFKVFTISLTQAIEWGIIPKPRVILIPLELNHDRYDQIIETNRGKDKDKILVTCRYEERWKYLKDKKNYPNLKLRLRCTEFQKNIWYNEQVDYNKQYGRLSRWLQMGSARKRYLSECKTPHARTVIKKISNLRRIIFCGTIKQAEELSKNVVHSKIKNPTERIESFNRKEIDDMSVVNMLQMGQNLTDIEAGLIVQLDGQEISFIQKSGRVLRAEDPMIIILYFKNTRDEEYLNKIRSEINSEYITITSLENFKV